MTHLNNLSSFNDRKQRDLVKSLICKERGITLIEIPYWWDRKSESLKATFYQQRPDLFPNKPNGIPIPNSEPAVTKTQTESKKKMRMLFIFSRCYQKCFNECYVLGRGQRPNWMAFI
jgi:hypothetical protein